MPGIKSRVPYTFVRYLQASQQNHASSKNVPVAMRQYSSSPLQQFTVEEQEKEKPPSPLPSPEAQTRTEDTSTVTASHHEIPEQGAMSRRLQQATEDALLEGGRAGRRAVEDAGFSEELKQKLLEKVEAHKFRAENTSAFAEAEIAAHVGRGSRDIATGQAWTGFESSEDSMLRMLNDARKPLKPGLRGPAKIPEVIVDLRLHRPKTQGKGERLANARDKSSIYAISKDAQMSEKEREDMRKDLKERFGSTAKTMPNSFRGLAALANERIEDAIARGQFKNIPRGKAIQRDARADNPFIDTTEYILNKMIQRQDIVPPWIEKQQELVKAANVLRTRLRYDWKRHAARTIASRGGSLQDQIRIADRYAQSEMLYNPQKRAVEQISIPTSTTEGPVIVSITQEVPKGPSDAPPVQIAVETKTPSQVVNATTPSEAPHVQVSEKQPPIDKPAALPPPFRIPAWEKAELSYLTLAIQNLNSITRSYNLMAPDLAKKPYFSLERELNACYADVAPQISQTLRDRAARPPKELVEKIGHRAGGLLERFGGETSRVFDSKKPTYGFREFWKELWSAKST